MGGFIDLTNQQFGEITVLNKDEQLSKEKKKIYWKCRCSCGREKSIRADNLKKTKTCGECGKDLTNQRFGRLIALEKGKKDTAQHQFWICQCDCGNIVEINSDNLRRGLTKSCGCLHSEKTHDALFKDIKLQRFGKLIALAPVINNDKVYWKCLCDCGNSVIVSRSNLISKHTQSCGCIKYSIGEANIAKVLKDNGIQYKSEYTFSDLPLRRFDFFIPSLNRLIEFDGPQHDTYVATWHKSEEEYLKAKQRDNEKNMYALNNSIDLVRIPYFERDNITLDLLLGDKYLIV